MKGVTRQSGFLARTLIAYPDSAMGSRYYKEPPKDLTALSAFHARIKKCLDVSLILDIKGCYEIQTLTFIPKARAKWIS